MVSKKQKTIAIVTVGAVIVALLVAYVTVPRSNDDDTLTPEQQQIVDDRLDHCFATGDC